MNVADLLQRWSVDLASWAIPDEFLRQADQSPWALPTQIFANRARRQAESPVGPSHAYAQGLFEEHGAVLDVGAGAAAASLPFADSADKITAVDASQEMLDKITHPKIEKICGTWPHVTAPIVDVVLCHHVLYNVPDLGPFLQALDGHARRGVVIEMTERHPMAGFNDLWWELHRLNRPTRPVADDAIEIMTALGFEPDVTRWERPAQAEFHDYQQRLEHTAIRLCLPKERLPELDQILRGREEQPRRLVSIRWRTRHRDRV